MPWTQKSALIEPQTSIGTEKPVDRVTVKRRVVEKELRRVEGRKKVRQQEAADFLSAGYLLEDIRARGYSAAELALSATDEALHESFVFILSSNIFVSSREIALLREDVKINENDGQY